jgi:uncharacterized spore protein YtfJ
MEAGNVISETRNAISVRRVFGKPYQRDGVVVIPVARIGGGGGGRGGGNGSEPSNGSGFGFRVSGQPVGVYVIRDGKVRWKPAIDVNRLLVRAQMVAAAGVLVTLARRRWR